MKKALITGITGQDGAYLSKFLLDKGYEVFGIVRKNGLPNVNNLAFLQVQDKLKLIPLDLMDLTGVSAVLNQIRPDEIYHLAAQSSVGFSFANPLATMDFNLRSTGCLLEAIRTLNLKTKFYQASSGEMYGKAALLPVTEETELQPLSPYAISKATGYWLLKNYRESYGLFGCNGILFNHESVLRPASFVIKKVIAAAVKISQGSKEKLVIGNLSVQRDWGYAPEYIKAAWLMLQQENPKDYIVATGQSRSLEEFVKLAFECLKLNYQEHSTIDKKLFRSQEIERTCGDPAKIKKIGWTYDFSFETLIEKLIQDEMVFQNR